MKLEDSPLRTREIYRTLSLASMPCEELLYELLAEKLVRHTGGTWHRLEPAALTAVTTNAPPLEV